MLLLVAALLVFLGMVGWLVFGVIWGKSLSQNQLLGWKPVTPIGTAVRWSIMHMTERTYGASVALSMAVLMVLSGAALNWLGEWGGLVPLAWVVVDLVELNRMAKVLRTVPK